MTTEFSWAHFLGGLAFFFFGMASLREGLQLVAGDRLRTLLLKLTNNRITGFGFGILLTLILQSSSATTAMLVSFAGVGLMTLQQAFAVILGADLGTTAVVFLLAARNMTDFALYGITLGFGLYLFNSHRKWRYSGQGIFGFAMIFYGISMIVAAMQPARESHLVQVIFAALADTPFWAMIGAAVFAAAIHSSAATIGLILSFSFAGILTLETALPLVVGANCGTSITIGLAAYGRDVNSRRVAGAHLITKLTGAIVAFPLLGYAAHGLQWITENYPWLHGPFANPLGMQIALAHLSFNLGVVCIFLPFLPFGVAIVTRLFSESKERSEPFAPRYLDRRTLQTPSLAFAQAGREVLRLANIAHELLGQCMSMFDRGVDIHHKGAEIQALDDKIDCLEKGIRFFLAELSQEMLTESQSKSQIALLGIAGDLEEIGDAIAKEMIQLAVKKHDRTASFSDSGWQELRNFHEQLDDLFSMTIGCLTTRDHHLAKNIQVQAASLHGMETESRMAHLQRLGEGLKESVDTSSIHLDLLSLFSRIASKLTHTALMSVEI